MVILASRFLLMIHSYSLLNRHMEGVQHGGGLLCIKVEIQDGGNKSPCNVATLRAGGIGHNGREGIFFDE